MKQNNSICKRILLNQVYLINSENKMPSMKLAFDELIEKFKLNDNNPSLDCIDISHHSSIDIPVNSAGIGCPAAMNVRPSG